MEPNNKILQNIIKQLETPMMKALAFAIKNAYDLLKKNNGKIYISNILGFFVNEKNKGVLINEVGFVPKLNRTTCKKLVEELASCGLIQKYEGSRSAIYLTFENELYEEYRKHLLLVKAKEIKDEDLIYVGFAIKTISELYPINKGNVYLSTVYSFFLNEKNHKKIKDEFGFIPTYSKDELEFIFYELFNKKLIIKTSGDRGAIFARLNFYKFNLFAKSIRKEYSLEEIWSVAYATKRVSEQYPQNNGKIYISNVYTYFINKGNHKEIKDLFGKVPEFLKADIERIVEKLVENKIVMRKVGNRGARYIILNEKNYFDFVNQFQKDYCFDDFKAIVLAITELDKRFPQNKGNIYISNIWTYFINEKNYSFIMENLGRVPKFSRRDIINISTLLTDKNVLKKSVGDRGSTYLQLDYKAWETYLLEQIV